MVVFQFDGSATLQSGSTAEAAAAEAATTDAGKALEKMGNASYFDRLNSWMGQILQRDCPNVC